MNARAGDIAHHIAPTLLLVPGSQRMESYNARLLTDLSARLHGCCTVDLLAAEQVDLPLFNQDLETEPDVVRRVAAVHRRFAASHGVIVATPEYNGQLPPYLKNLVDWVSRLTYIDSGWTNAFVDRPVLLCSASTGRSGGTVAISSARALFGYVGCVVIGDTISVSQASRVWAGNSYAFDDVVDNQVNSALSRVVRLASDFARAQNMAVNTI
jgi:chromate reductase